MAHTARKAHTVELGARGRLVLPASVRKELDLREGERLLLTVEPSGVLRLSTARDVAEGARGLWREVAPGRSLADELIAERREEAQRE